MSYTYVRSEPALWTVGHNDQDGRWHPESDHGTDEEAARRTAWLNGSPSDHALLVEQRDEALAEAAQLTQVRALVDRWNNDRDAFPDGASPVLDELTDILGGAR